MAQDSPEGYTGYSRGSVFCRTAGIVFFDLTTSFLSLHMLLGSQAKCHDGPTPGILRTTTIVIRYKRSGQSLLASWVNGVLFAVCSRSSSESSTDRVGDFALSHPAGTLLPHRINTVHAVLGFRDFGTPATRDSSVLSRPDPHFKVGDATEPLIYEHSGIDDLNRPGAAHFESFEKTVGKGSNVDQSTSILACLSSSYGTIIGSKIISLLHKGHLIL
ncbi:hypothetical protein SISSUDRAFT_1031518 [Sistotremastrum suecicum HHB10207 ss-3]|uniref:Uncharacterized protein n=1 Tax=Sistotremastrum suecicum HHB10207 ss-3 TaxID=1314776 RepID=A0A166FRI9_9AGAM|nr:hypothetical protein SISSUDRAFT_1031518 [Sistotremastrum suecicum HHB10207 ss-3]